MFGGLLAGAQVGLLGNERLHVGVVTLAVVVDVAILRAAARHHRSPWPMALLLVGGVAVALGHATAEVVELGGFALVIAAAVLNAILMRRHRAAARRCCPHETDVPFQKREARPNELRPAPSIGPSRAYVLRDRLRVGTTRLRQATTTDP
jgi:hypothetical protein